MLKKLKEIFGFPTEQEKAAAKDEVKAETVTVSTADNVFPFPKDDKPEAEPVKPRVKRTPKPKAEPAAKAPAKKPAAKKPAAKKPVTSRKPKQAKAE